MPAWPDYRTRSPAKRCLPALLAYSIGPEPRATLPWVRLAESNLFIGDGISHCSICPLWSCRRLDRRWCLEVQDVTRPLLDSEALTYNAAQGVKASAEPALTVGGAAGSGPVCGPS